MVSPVCGGGGGESGKYMYIYVYIMYFGSLLPISEVLVDMVLFERGISLKLTLRFQKLTSGQASICLQIRKQSSRTLSVCLLKCFPS